MLLCLFPAVAGAQVRPAVIREAGQMSPMRPQDKNRDLDILLGRGVNWKDIYITNARTLEKTTLDRIKGNIGLTHLCTGIRLADAAGAIMARDTPAVNDCVDQLAVLTEMTGVTAGERARLESIRNAAVQGSWEQAAAEMRCLQHIVLDRFTRRNRELGVLAAAAHYAQSLRYAAEGVHQNFKTLPDRYPQALLHDYQWTRWLTAELTALPPGLRVQPAHEAFFTELPVIHRLLNQEAPHLTKEDVSRIKSMADRMTNNIMEAAGVDGQNVRAIAGAP